MRQYCRVSMCKQYKHANAPTARPVIEPAIPCTGVICQLIVKTPGQLIVKTLMLTPQSQKEIEGKEEEEK